METGHTTACEWGVLSHLQTQEEEEKKSAWAQYNNTNLVYREQTDPLKLQFWKTDFNRITVAKSPFPSLEELEKIQGVYLLTNKM